MTTPSTRQLDANVQPLRRWMQINVCVLCCLASLVFAAAEGRPLALLSVPIAMIGLLFVDRQEMFAVSSVGANVLGFGAFVLAGVEFFSDSPEGQLLGFAHLLVYLSWILLLQRKETAQFWWLCALSALQVATASVLTNDLWFPLAAILYMLLALWTLSVFTLDRAVTHAAGVVRSAQQTPHAATAGSTESSDTSRSRSNVQTETSSRWITPRFVTGVLINGLLSLLLGLTIFLLTPRIWAGGLHIFGQSESPARQPLTGFTEEVQLGDMGEILENPNLVLQVKFYDHQTDAPLNVEQALARQGSATPLFRGKVLGRYSNGRWSPHGISARSRRSYVPRGVPLMRQEIRLSPIGTRTLFAAGHALSCQTRAAVRIDHELFSDTFSLFPEEDTSNVMQQDLDYVAYSPLSGEPVRLFWGGRDAERRRRTYQQSLTALPDDLGQLQQLARQVTAARDSEPLSDREQATALVHHLRDSGQYQYTMSVAVSDPQIDPVEDFLFNRREGHCEYFASALALMLRSVEIPSRLVSGFKGGQLNTSTGQYEVRQLHAHAWVEAFLDDQWVVLDPTPAARDESVATIATTEGPFAKIRQHMHAWWSHGLTMNQTMQQQLIYRPLKDLFSDGLRSIRRVGLLQATLSLLRELSTNPAGWISVRGFITAFTLMLLLSGLIWLGRRLWHLLSGWTRDSRSRSRQQRRVVDFYERFRTALARRGYVRDQQTTQHEFAMQIEQDWQNRPEIDGLARFPTRLTDAFYRVRFGNSRLSAAELQDLDTQLLRLENWSRRSTSS